MQRHYRTFLARRWSLFIATHLEWVSLMIMAVMGVLFTIDALLLRLTVSYLLLAVIAYAMWRWAAKHKAMWETVTYLSSHIGVKHISKVDDVAHALKLDAQAQIALAKSNWSTAHSLSELRPFLTFAEEEARTNILVAKNRFRKVNEVLRYFGLATKTPLRSKT